MARKKRSSRVLQKAQHRLDGILSVNPKFSAGTGFTAAGYTKAINELRSEISNYNIALSNLDAMTNIVAEKEKMVSEYSSRMLLGVASYYGKDSHEYEKAGGVRKQDRKRPVRKMSVAMS